MPKVSICVDVSDIKQGTKFYATALGCEIRQEKHQSSELTTENITIHLIKKEENSNPLINESASRNYKRHWPPVHLDFAVADIQKTVSLIQEFGGTLEEEKEGEWGAAAFCADPFGNGFCIIKINV
jgi:predicted enzyme related to lactoylglutathione lyase